GSTLSSLAGRNQPGREKPVHAAPFGAIELELERERAQHARRPRPLGIPEWSGVDGFFAARLVAAG
ncbi:MAG: hypothetical protein P8Y82_02455, partial [Methyloceanibacter sp.]